MTAWMLHATCDWAVSRGQTTMALIDPARKLLVAHTCRHSGMVLAGIQFVV